MFNIISLISLTIVAVFCGTTTFAEEINPVLGKTADFVLREADLERLIGGQAPEVQQKFKDDPEQKVTLVKQLLTQKAIVARARKEGFDKKPDIREQLSHVVDDFIAREYVAKVASAATVREDELKKYYRENEASFQIPAQIKVRHIFVEVPTDATPEIKSRALTKAETVLQRLKKGEEFAKLAAELSDDPDSGKRGGEIGTLTPGSTSSEDFEKAAFALKAGDTSGVVTSPYGYHIIKVDERTEKRVASFDEAKEYIRTKLQSEAEKTRLQELIDQVTKESGLELFTEKITGTKPDAGPEKQK
jgi:peptidyl-prolyl cis-trans isomerase C